MICARCGRPLPLATSYGDELSPTGRVWCLSCWMAPVEATALDAAYGDLVAEVIEAHVANLPPTPDKALAAARQAIERRLKEIEQAREDLSFEEAELEGAREILKGAGSAHERMVRA